MQAIVSHVLASHLLCGLLGRFKELMESGLAKGEHFEICLHAASTVFGVSRTSFCFCTGGRHFLGARLLFYSHREPDMGATSQMSPCSRCEA